MGKGWWEGDNFGMGGGMRSVLTKKNGSVWAGVIVEICFRMLVRNGYLWIFMAILELESFSTASTKEWPMCL